MNDWASRPARSVGGPARATAVRTIGALLLGVTCCTHLARSTHAAAQSPSSAPAESARDRARELGDLGLAAYDAGSYAQARELFRQALESYDFPTLRLYLARSLAKQNRPVAASAEYAALLARPVQTDEGDAGTRARAAAGLEILDAQARRPRLTLSASGDVRGVRVEASGPSQPELVLGRECFAEPGSYQLRAAHADGRTWVRSITLSEGRAERIEIDWSEPAPVAPTSLAPPSTAALSATAPRDTAPPAPASGNSPAWVAGVITGVLLGGTIVTGFIAADRKSDYDAANADGDVSDDDKRDLRDSAFDMQVVNTALAAGTVIGAGATLYFVLRAPDTESGAAIAGRAPSGWQLGLSGEF